MIERMVLGVLLASVSLSSGLVMAQSDAATPVTRHRVVMHVNSGDEQVQRGVVSNIRNLYQELGRERLALEVVAHGAGLSLLTTNTTAFRGDLTTLQAEFGVQYTACSNTMKALRLTRSDLIAEVGDTVPAMVRLMERQEQGWAYIKP
jgi:uncharacterized protein